LRDLTTVGPGSGRPREGKRAARAAKLRAKGLTEAQIGARLGITRQAVQRQGAFFGFSVSPAAAAGEL
jgi:hypothetical protein